MYSHMFKLLLYHTLGYKDLNLVNYKEQVIVIVWMFVTAVFLM